MDLAMTCTPSWSWPCNGGTWAHGVQVITPGMVFFLYMVLVDSAAGLAMSLGETGIVTGAGFEPVCHAPRNLVVN